MDQSIIDNIFRYHAPQGEQAGEYELIRGEARRFAMLLYVLCPDNREKSIAMTRLEEVVMWANASIARNPEGRTL